MTDTKNVKTIVTKIKENFSGNGPSLENGVHNRLDPNVNRVEMMPITALSLVTSIGSTISHRQGLKVFLRCDFKPNQGVNE